MFCPHCGIATAPQSSFCSACGANVAAQQAAANRTRVVRPLYPRMVAGVCSGIALHYGWDVAIVRIVLIAATCLTTGCAILFYLAAWVLIPEALYAQAPATPYVRQGTTV
jgi:phage shock protein C